MSSEPSWEEVAEGARVVRVPMHVPFRGVRHREALLVQGPAGWGEFSAFLEYDDVEAARWLAAGIEAAWRGWPQPLRSSIPVNATIPAVAASDVPAVLARFPGCTTAKVKVAERGQALGDDVDRVAATRVALGPAGRVRIDANGGWSVDDAARALAALAPFDLEYAEQPCTGVEELLELRVRLARAGVDVVIAADESVRKASDPLRVARSGAADVLVLKVAPLGGVRPALALADACGLPVVVSSGLDTAVGIRSGVALAAALPSLPYACGLATGGLFVADVADVPTVGGSLTTRPVAPDAKRLDRLAASPDRVRWWLDRARRCNEVLRRSSP